MIALMIEHYPSSGSSLVFGRSTAFHPCGFTIPLEHWNRPETRSAQQFWQARLRREPLPWRYSTDYRAVSIQLVPDADEEEVVTAALHCCGEIASV